MTQLLIMLESYTWLGLWLFACLVQGVAFWGILFDRLGDTEPPWPNPELAVFFTVCAGLSLNILVLTLLGVLHLLTPAGILVSLSALTLAALFVLRFQTAYWAKFAAVFGVGWSEWVRVLPILLLILPWLVRPLGPVSGMDALTYHLPYARFYLEQGGLVANETLRLPYHANNLNLLYSVALIRPGPDLAQMLHAALGFGAMLGVYGLARHWYGWFSAALAALGMLLMAEFVHSFEHAYADNGVTVFVTAAFISLAFWLEGRRTGFLWACALFAGMAMGTKYFGSLMTIPLGLAVLWYSKSLKLTAKFALLTAVFGLFWYVRSWWITGNPVHPFAGDIFGHYLWSARELADNMHQLDKWGIEKSITNFYQLPFKLSSEAESFNGKPGNAGYVLAAFFLSFLFFLRQKPAVKLLQLTSLGFLVFWFSTSQVIRYLIMILPLMSLATVAVYSDLVLRFRPVREFVFDYEKCAFIVLLFLLSKFAVMNVWQDLHRIHITLDGKAKYLSENLPAYDLAVAAIFEPRIGDGPVMQFLVPEMKYLFTGQTVGDWMGEYSFLKFGHIGESGHWMIDRPDVLHAKITAAGIKAVAMLKNPPQVFKPYEISAYEEYFDFVLETEEGVLMVPKPVQATSQDHSSAPR